MPAPIIPTMPNACEYQNAVVSSAVGGSSLAPQLLADNESLIARPTASPGALFQSQELLRGIFDSAMDAIITVDEQQRILLFNAAAEKMFRCDAAEVLGQSIDRFIPPHFRAAHAGHMRHFGATGMTRRSLGKLGTLHALRADGEEFPMEASISALDAGDRQLFTIILRDVTERKRAEEALAAKMDELARSNRDLEQFAYVASHDLQEPLRMVASYAQLLAERYRGKLDENADKYIGYTVEGALRMQTLVRDLMAFSRAGRNSPNLRSTDCNAVVDEAAQNLRSAIEESGAVITHGELPVIAADPSQLSQVLQNLIGNAIKFRGKEPPAISVSVENCGAEWQFAVTDNGIGIAPEHQQVIFAVFQRLHTRAEYPGNGIGLAICEKIIEHHGGKIWVESRLGEGSAFKFTLPVAAPLLAQGATA